MAAKQIIRLSDPSIQECLDSHLSTIRSADSVSDLESSHAGKEGARGWLDSMSPSSPIRGKLKQLLDSAAFHKLIFLILSGQLSEQPHRI